jgi:L-asparaginase / beta-aspartyl-peptidase
MVSAHIAGVRAAASAGWRVLKAGGAALDAVEESVAVMEDDETFDAGRGSFLTSDGRVQLDALLMDGATLRAGGVGCVERLRNPIHAARKVLDDSPHIYLVGSGAEQFAKEHGIQLCSNRDLIVQREVERLKQEQSKTAGAKSDTRFSSSASHDTVGAVAVDARGNLAAATSTGGTLNKAPGRIGDSSLIGCGCYADNLSASVSCTGWGEPLMKLVLGKWACDRVAEGATPQATAEKAIAYLQSRLDGHGGMILLDARGRLGMAHNTPRMAWAAIHPGGETSGISFTAASLSR